MFFVTFDTRKHEKPQTSRFTQKNKTLTYQEHFKTLPILD